MKLFNKRNKKGQDMIEAVIVIPIFFLILAFSINIAQILINTYVVKEAVYSGARSAIVCTNEGQAQVVSSTQAKKMLENAMSIKNVQVSTNAEGGWAKNNLLHVKITCDVDILFPWVDGDFKMTKQQRVSQEIYMMIENQ